MKPTPSFVASRAVAVAAVLLVVAACSGGGAVPSSPGSSVASTSPSSPALPSPSASSSGGSIATDVPPSDPGTGSAIDPSGGKLTIPKPGQLDVHEIKAESLSTVVDGRRVVLTIGWTSGVEPCYTLDTILVTKGDHSFAITLREGHGAEDVMCIQIAEMKRTEVELGDLEPGTYTITDATGGAPAIEVVVS
jgi:hypothetical protein